MVSTTKLVCSTILGAWSLGTQTNLHKPVLAAIVELRHTYKACREIQEKTNREEDSCSRNTIIKTLAHMVQVLSVEVSEVLEAEALEGPAEVNSADGALIAVLVFAGLGSPSLRELVKVSILMIVQ